MNEEELRKSQEDLRYRIIKEAPITDDEQSLNGIDPDATPLAFFGQYAPPSPKESSFKGKYVVMSIIPPNGGIYKKYLRFTLVKYLYHTMDMKYKAYNVLHDQPGLLHDFNELFKNEIALNFTKGWGNWMNVYSDKIIDEFHEYYPESIDIENDPKKMSHNLAKHVMRIYAIFNNSEDADRYVTKNYDSDYRFPLQIAKMGKWIAYHEYQRNVNILKPIDIGQKEVIDTLRNYHNDQIKNEEEIQSRMMASDRHNTEVVRKIRNEASKRMKKKIRDTTAKNFADDVLNELSKLLDKTLRKKTLKALRAITPLMIEERSNERLNTTD